jgi:predicted nucleic acid-binding protein
MSVECFLDTNVLLYAATASASERAKQDAAYKVIEADNFGVSVQVLQEFYSAATSKAKVRMEPHIALSWLAEIEHRPCIAVDRALFELGVAISRRFRIGYWDGAIIAAAEALGATTLYTEDLSDGQLYGSVRVVNPFAGIQ